MILREENDKKRTKLYSLNLISISCVHDNLSLHQRKIQRGEAD